MVEFLILIITYCPKMTVQIANSSIVYGGEKPHTPEESRSRIVDVSQKQCFAVFCGVL